MARQKRQISRTGIYHLMLRGNNRAKVFYTKADVRKFLEILEAVKNEYKFKIYAFVFMKNHVHLVVKEPESGLVGKFMQSLQVRYIRWYNIEHRRTGRIFQDRYKSEAVENAQYLQYLVRYVHRNPVKAKLCKHVWDYPDSSYKYFLSEDPWIIDRDEVFEYIDRSEFEEFNDCASLKSEAEVEMNNAGISFMEMQETVPFRLTNEMAHKAMKTVAGLFNSTEITNLPICDIIVAVQKLRKRGLSYGQISRELSKNKGTVYRWANKEAV